MKKENKKNKILIMGIGNEILMDDGIGPRLVHDLQNHLNMTHIDYSTAFLGGLETIEYIQGYQKVIFLDALKSVNGVPGEVHIFTPADFRETLHLSSLHDVSFLNALSLGKEIGFVIPEKIHIIAVEIVEDQIFGEVFSPEIQKKYPEIFKFVSTKVREMIG